MRVQASDSDFGDECGNQGKVGHISSKYLISIDYLGSCRIQNTLSPTL